MKRSSVLRYDRGIPLVVAPAVVWGYNKKGKFVCRVEINGAGVAVFAGTKGRKKLANVTWEGLVKKLTKKD